MSDSDMVRRGDVLEEIESKIRAATLALGGSLPGLPRVRRHRYGAWTVPGPRETARLAWRARVKYLETRLRDARCSFGQDGHRDDCAACEMAEEWCDLHRPSGRPWRSPRRPDPRRRYSRRHRRECAECRDTVDVVRVWMDCEKRELELGYDALASASRDHWTRWRRDPHGRRS